MMDQDPGRFYQAALTAGSILSGFIGTFLSFRIQRESNYYRQPFMYRETEKTKSESVHVGQSQFPSSLLLVILGAVCAVLFGVFFPLSAVAGWGPLTLRPPTILAGIVASLVLVAAYFLNELTHYEILKLPRLRQDLARWSKSDVALVVGGILLAALLACITYHSAKGA